MSRKTEISQKLDGETAKTIAGYASKIYGSAWTAADIVTLIDERLLPMERVAEIRSTSDHIGIRVVAGNDGLLGLKSPDERKVELTLLRQLIAGNRQLIRIGYERNVRGLTAEHVQTLPVTNGSDELVNGVWGRLSSDYTLSAVPLSPDILAPRYVYRPDAITNGGLNITTAFLVNPDDLDLATHYDVEYKKGRKPLTVVLPCGFEVAEPVTLDSINRALRKSDTSPDSYLLIRGKQDPESLVVRARIATSQHLAR